MTEALNIFYNIYSTFIGFIFGTDSEFISGVSLGWFFVSCFVFSILISNIINIPKKGSSFKIGGSNKSGSNNHN